MQINFEPKKLKEANSYVDQLKPLEKENAKKKIQNQNNSLFKRIKKFLFH